MKERDRSAPAIAWVAVCLLALGVGFYLGERQNALVWERFNAHHEQAAAGGRRCESDSLALNEHSISRLVRDAGRSVVSIEVQAQSQSSETPHVVPGLLPQPENRVVGSGIIIKPDGYIVTSNHVIGLDKGIHVVLSDGRRLPATVVGRDWLSSAAILKVAADNLPAARIGDSDNVEPGDFAVCIGCPMRLDHTVSLGIISAVNRSINDGEMPAIGLIQTDAAMNPGSSGGALLNLRGEVIGMNSAVRRDAQNISFAVPIDVIMQAADMLISDGSVAHAYMGVYMAGSRESTQSAGSPENGVYVIAVRDGPAKDAGIRSGDIIEALDDRHVTQSSEVRRLLLNHKPGDRLKLQLLQQGIRKTVTLTLAQSPSDPHP